MYTRSAMSPLRKTIVPASSHWRVMYGRSQKPELVVSAAAALTRLVSRIISTARKPLIGNSIACSISIGSDGNSAP